MTFVGNTKNGENSSHKDQQKHDKSEVMLIIIAITPVLQSVGLFSPVLLSI
jgi:hypothetical protein